MPGVAHGKRNPTKLCKTGGMDASRIKWRRILNANETIKIRSLVLRHPKTI